MTLLMAACCAAGQTVLRGAAQEPEIGDMIAFLSACGADIQGAGTPVLTVQGGRPLAEPFTARCRTASPPRPTPPHWRARADRSKLRAATRPAMTRFCAFWPGPACRSAGSETACGLARDPAVPLRGGAHLRADAWPAFATDTAPLAAAVLLTAAGESEIYDSLFANRFACAAGFAAMGAACTVRGRQLTLPGGAVLHGTDVTAPDLRGGAALLAAALAADGETRLRDPGHIPRGYENLPAALRGLGAEIS